MEYYLVVSTFMMFAGIYGFFTRRNFIGHAHQCRTDTEFGRHQLRRIQPIPLSRGTGSFFSPCLLSA